MVKHTLLVLQFTWRVKQTTGQYWIQTCISGPQIIPHSKVSLLTWENISHSIKYVRKAPCCPWVYSGLYGGMCHNPPLEFLFDLFFNRHWLGQVWTICRLPCINLAVDRLSHNSSALLSRIAETLLQLNFCCLTYWFENPIEFWDWFQARPPIVKPSSSVYQVLTWSNWLRDIMTWLHDIMTEFVKIIGLFWYLNQ